MAKKKVKVETISVTKPKIPIAKYFQLYAPEVHKYTQAFLNEEFRGILEFEEEWKLKLKEYMG